MSELENTTEQPVTEHPAVTEEQSVVTEETTPPVASDEPITEAQPEVAEAEVSSEPTDVVTQEETPVVQETPAESDPATTTEENTDSAAVPAVEEASPAADAPASETASEVEAATTSQEGGEGAEGEDENGLQLRRARKPEVNLDEIRPVWEELQKVKQENGSIEVTVVLSNRGGIVGSYKGVEIFVPMSQMTLSRSNSEAALDILPNSTFLAKILEITEFETDARRVTATRRPFLRDEFRASLEAGQRIKGRVRTIMDFGAFVDLGGIDGLVHVSEISHSVGKKPADLLKKGEEVEVLIKRIEPEKDRIYLSMKELLPSPWEGVEARYEVGTICRGKITGLGKMGVYVEIEPGVEGFAHISELSWTRRVHDPKEMFQYGQDVDVKILKVIESKHRMSLSIRQVADNPWIAIADKFAVGTSHDGDIREISNKGVLVGVGDVEGFLPRGRMGREAQKLPQMTVGQPINVNVIEINPETRSIIFGLPYSGGGESGSGGGGGRRDDRKRDRGDRREREQMQPVSATNEMKTSETVTSFSLGDMLGDAIKKQLNTSSNDDSGSERSSDTSSDQ